MGTDVELKHRSGEPLSWEEHAVCVPCVSQSPESRIRGGEYSQQRPISAEGEIDGLEAWR